MRLEDLKLYQECLDFEKEIWDIANNWDGLIRDTVAKPIIQTSDAISGNIALGYGRYNYKDKRHYCYVSRGYILKSRGWIIKAKERDLIEPEKADELLAFNEKIHRMLNAYVRSIGRLKDNTYNKPSYHKDHEESNTVTNQESNGNSAVSETTKEANGNSFTADADEFFSSDDLTNS